TSFVCSCFVYSCCPSTTLCCSLSLHDALPISRVVGDGARRQGHHPSHRGYPVAGERSRRGQPTRQRAACRREGTFGTPHARRSEIGRAHVCTPVTFRSRMQSSA